MNSEKAGVGGGGELVSVNILFICVTMREGALIFLFLPDVFIIYTYTYINMDITRYIYVYIYTSIYSFIFSCWSRSPELTRFFLMFLMLITLYLQSIAEIHIPIPPDEFAFINTPKLDFYLNIGINIHMRYLTRVFNCDASKGFFFYCDTLYKFRYVSHIHIFG